MSFLTLKNIGKIYVSEGNVAVGIRGVNLSFDMGEFVAITGKSGSGKSTLLNVISGMDTYEEGELYIEDSPTSHYLQSDWEKYREKYISFIFQDYNIIDSFTVLQNVELALMNIGDLKERRRRAVELIKRVGLEKQMRHKGSKLSGGQKQRTVIARALAKDSPVILADEPTGNLDSQTSAEIINLLREVSKDKLVIVVTHNYEQFEGCATRQIRIFDGSVESDHLTGVKADIESAPSAKEKPAPAAEGKRKKAGGNFKNNLKNGSALGRAIFTSKPRLTIFMCVLLAVGTLGIFFTTVLCGDAAEMFEKKYMFTQYEGRLVVTKQTGEPISDAEIAEYVSKTGAESWLHYDFMLDTKISAEFEEIPWEAPISGNFTFSVSYIDGACGKIVGRMPEKAGECLLCLPLSAKPYFGSEKVEITRFNHDNFTLDICGVSYYSDDSSPEIIVTEETFRIITAAVYLSDSDSEVKAVGKVTADGTEREYSLTLHPSFLLEKDEVYAENLAQYLSTVKNAKTVINISVAYKRSNYAAGISDESGTYEKEYTDLKVLSSAPETSENTGTFFADPDILVTVAEGAMKESYRQLSLFYGTDAEAAGAAKVLKEMNLIAVTSDTTYSPDMSDIMFGVLEAVLYLALWAAMIIFLAFFINLCTSRSVAAFKPDMAIMRSMGIQTPVIKAGIYFRMLLSAIPSVICIIAAGLIIFNSPKLCGYFTFLPLWGYVAVIAGVILLVLLITRKQIKKLFSESVKKTIRGGAAV